MEKIRSLFAKPIDRKIEEVIKVDQANEQTVLSELEEYIVTDSIKDHFRMVYDEIISVSKSPREGIGVWVSEQAARGNRGLGVRVLRFRKILFRKNPGLHSCGHSRFRQTRKRDLQGECQRRQSQWFD